MNVIEAKDITKVFGGKGHETRALRGVTFTIEKGEFVALMGPSGSGKSTLLHILGFLDPLTAGEYRFNGKTFEGYTPDELAHIRNKNMGFIFQSFNLLSRSSVLDNVMLPLQYSGYPEREWEDMALERIAKVGLMHRILHTPAQLSGGEKQRVAIARALVTDPDVVFADEPTGNLDSESGGNVMKMIQELNEKEGRTVILITHEKFTSEHAKRAIHIHDGEIVSDKKIRNRRKASDKLLK